MRKLIVALAAVGGLGFLYANSRLGEGSPAPLNRTGVPNPLPACPDSPNCVRDSRLAKTSKPDAMANRVAAALERMGATEIRRSGDDFTAVFPIAVFKDDFRVQIDPYVKGSVVHVRSASRVGYSDLGVNGKRVERFWNELGLRGRGAA
ncbi:MAG: DUF1499 domain-containing protein [Bacteroidota bacterium]